MTPVAGQSGVTRALLPRRVAVLSVHTSPLEQPGTGDAGGMNVYVLQTARRMAQLGTEVEIFTRATSSELPPSVELEPGVTVRHVVAGPFEGLAKDELPAQLCAFTAGVMRAEARHEAGWYDVMHSHYWLSGQVGWLARERWGVPLVHSAHTLAKVKNEALAAGDRPEPRARLIGEEQVVAEADRLVTNTGQEARQLQRLYDADPQRTVTIPPGVDLDCFTPRASTGAASTGAGVPGGTGVDAAARAALGLRADELVLAFVGRIQPLKAPDVLLRAAARLLAQRPELADRLRVLVVGGPSGSGLDRPDSLIDLADSLGIRDLVRFEPPRPPEQLADVYRAADVVAVPSYNESFGLVAVEAQACGTPVVAADVGGLSVAVSDGVTGRLVTGHDPQRWASALGEVALQPRLRSLMAAAAPQHAQRFSWDRTARELMTTYGHAIAAFRAERGAGPYGRHPGDEVAV